MITAREVFEHLTSSTAAKVVQNLTALVLAAGIPLLFSAGFMDARRPDTRWFFLEEVEQLILHVFVRCPGKLQCEFAYRVRGVDLLLVDLGSEKVRTPDITVEQERRTENIRRMTTFLTEKNSVVSIAAGTGVTTMLIDSIKNSPQIAEMREKVQESAAEAPPRRFALILVLLGASYGTGYFVAEHWFPAGPGSHEKVALAKQSLATPEFQRMAVFIIANLWDARAEKWPAANVVPDGCTAIGPPRGYPPNFASDETFAGTVMTVPCNRAEFYNVVAAIRQRHEILKVNGRGLRIVDAQMVAGLQQYAELQGPKPKPEVTDSTSDYLTGAVIIVGAVASLAVLALAVYVLLGALHRFYRRRPVRSTD